MLTGTECRERPLCKGQWYRYLIQKVPFFDQLPAAWPVLPIQKLLWSDNSLKRSTWPDCRGGWWTRQAWESLSRVPIQTLNASRSKSLEPNKLLCWKHRRRQKSPTSPLDLPADLPARLLSLLECRPGSWEANSQAECLWQVVCVWASASTWPQEAKWLHIATAPHRIGHGGVSQGVS